MYALIIRFFMMLFCMFPLFTEQITYDNLIALLAAFIFSCFGYFFSSQIPSSIFVYSYLFLCIIFPQTMYFFPVIALDIVRIKAYPALCLYVPLVFSSLSNRTEILYLILGCMLSLFWEHFRIRYETLLSTSKKARDDSRELTLALQTNNRILIEKQNYETHNATLKERSRIAREIHDNVGHLITRCILMTGVLKTVNTQDACQEPIHVLEDTLADAMENIRTSVHNLHDTSIDLKKTLEDIVNSYTFCCANLIYDVEQAPPSDICYTFISIVKEAFTNTAKHSNASSITVTVREHPALYQLIVKDNHAAPVPYTINLTEENRQNAGIGLINMYDRVKALKGTILITHDSGFKIFVIIPKENHSLHK